MKLLNDYVYRSLSDFGNTFVMQKTYKAIGEEAILEDLKENGFNCKIEKRYLAPEVKEIKTSKQLSKRKSKDVIYLITRKEV